ncbi:MAG TPA: hypothetical protein VFV31_09585 [Chitinophagaceae bacterium]|nr:hypothetical protein [Chitinophagaceae bacterium]
MIKSASILVLILFSCAGYAQYSLSDITQKSEKYYKGFKKIYFKVNNSFKSSIAESYSTTISEISYCKQTHTIISISNNTQIILTKNKYYYINNDKKEYIDLSSFKEFKDEKKKYFDDYPGINPNFFDRFKTSRFKIVRNGSFFHIYNDKENYYFDTLQYALVRYKSINFDVTGVQIKEWLIEDQKIENKCFENSSIFKFLKEFQQIHPNENSNINQSLMGKSIKSLLTGNDLPELNIQLLFFDSLFKFQKFILLDFFYQSCMPCIMSFKNLKALTSDSSSVSKKLLIIGVDPVLQDSASMQKFKYRYKLDYSIITGKKAAELNTILNPGNSFPYYIVVNPQGEIIEVKEGYDENFFEKVRKIVLK